MTFKSAYPRSLNFHGPLSLTWFNFNHLLTITGFLIFVSMSGHLSNWSITWCLKHVQGVSCTLWQIYSCIFSNKNDGIPIQISLKFVPSIQIDNKQATSYYLSQWWPSLLTPICGTRGRWVNLSHLYMASLCVLSVHSRKQQQRTQSQTRTHTRTQQHPRHSLTHQINKSQHTSPDQWTNILICSLIHGNT